MKNVLILIGALVLVIGLAVGGWQGGWWLQQSAVNHQGRIYNTSYGAQSAWKGELGKSIVTIKHITVEIDTPNTPSSEKSALRDQQRAEIYQACAIAATITYPLSAQEHQWIATNCTI